MSRGIRGIALLASVITIIVMLILAAVVMFMTIDPNRDTQTECRKAIEDAKEAIINEASNRVKLWNEKNYDKKEDVGTITTAGLAVTQYDFDLNEDENTPQKEKVVDTEKVETSVTTNTITIKSKKTRTSDGRYLQVIGTVNDSGFIARWTENWVK